MIHYIHAYDSSPKRNIGGAINKAIKQLHACEDDWIINLDSDTLFLLPDTKARIERILSTTNYDILGCITNRLALSHQLVAGMFDEYDVRKHIEVAKALQSDETQPYDHVLAAFCLCFKVKTWRKLGGFAENSITFDTTFSIMARRSGMRLGLMAGVYIFHAYRLLSTNPKMDFEHLLPHISDEG